MLLPDDLQAAISEMLSLLAPKVLRQAAEQMQAGYRRGDNSFFLFSQEHCRAAYLASRLPATYAAAFHCLLSAKNFLGFQPRRFLDVGAGPGTASWAASALFAELEKISCLEPSKKMSELGQALAAHSSFLPLQNAEWLSDGIVESDFAMFSYVLSEIAPTQQLYLLDKVWGCGARAIALVEPGTPKGFENILRARQWALSKGAYLLAPCPDSAMCPFQKKTGWCHFPARVSRSRLHRFLKYGEMGYEDEKFSYLVFGKEPHSYIGARLVGSPQKRKGRVCLSLCKEGAIEELGVGHHEEAYRKARKSRWGDFWEGKL